VGPRSDLDDMKKWKLLILPGLELQPFYRPVRCSRYTESATATLLMSCNLLKFSLCIYIYMARGSVVVKVLDYKLEGRGFDTWWGEILNLPNLSDRTRPWGLLSL
jgi:hypothetical protein